MMGDWRHGIRTPHLATSIPHYHGLDFGRTMPLRHPPTTVHGRPNITSSPQTFLPFSHPLGHPLPIPVANRELTISPSSSSLSSSQIQASTNESTVRAQNVEKKRWQTANYRWMFTKRKGNKFNLLSIELKHYRNMPATFRFLIISVTSYTNTSTNWFTTIFLYIITQKFLFLASIECDFSSAH